MVDTVVIVVAAGSGERLGLAKPKAFVEVGGRPILALAVEGVARCRAIDRIVVAAPPDAVLEARRIVSGRPDVSVVAGGPSRHVSVALAIDAIGGRPERIVCHDAARPFASAALFDAVLDGLERWDGCIPGIPVTDTIKRIAGDAVVATEVREDLRAAQTPQAFRGDALIEAHRLAAAERRTFTDDSACVGWAGYSVGVVPGEVANLKITTPDDLARAHGAVVTGTAIDA